MKPFSLTFLSLAVLLEHTTAAALPHIEADTPIPLNAFKFASRDGGVGGDPHAGIDPDLIRKYASMASPQLAKRVYDFNPEEQLIDGTSPHLRPFARVCSLTTCHSSR